VELKKGETLMIDAYPHLPATLLHKSFSDRSGFPPDHFELYYRGKRLEGEAALSSWGVGKDAVIEVKMRGRGGAWAVAARRRAVAARVAAAATGTAMAVRGAMARARVMVKPARKSAATATAAVSAASGDGGGARQRGRGVPRVRKPGAGGSDARAAV